MPTRAAAYQATDLARRAREVVDDARSHHVLVRDKDGMLLSFGPAEDLERSEELLRVVGDWLRMEGAIRVPRSQRQIGAYGNLAWASSLDDEDQVLFLRELEDALLVSLSGGTLDAVRNLLYDWKATAEVAADPDLSVELAEDLPEPVDAEL